MQRSELSYAYSVRWIALFPACSQGGSRLLVSYRPLGQAAVKTGFLPMSGRSRAQRERVEASTDGEARIFINSPEDLQAGLDRLTFEPRKSPDPPEVGPDVFAQALQHIVERDQARRERDEQVALRAEEREAANAAFKAADAERDAHLATIRD